MAPRKKLEQINQPSRHQWEWGKQRRVRVTKSKTTPNPNEHLAPCSAAVVTPRGQASETDAWAAGSTVGPAATHSAAVRVKTQGKTLLSVNPRFHRRDRSLAFLVKFSPSHPAETVSRPMCPLSFLTWTHSDFPGHFILLSPCRPPLSPQPFFLLCLLPSPLLS